MTLPDPAGDARQLASLTFENRFVASLPGDERTDNVSRQVLGACYSRVAPTSVALPECIALVPEVCELLSLEPSVTPTVARVLGGNEVLAGMAPYAACYGGHQFGNWAGQLGDGRAITLTEVVNARGDRFEIQLKGAGPTPYSRRSDGRAVLRSSLRELVASEAMHHLGVPTTRALSLVRTGDGVERDMLYDGHPEIEQGAITCRVAPSFLRFGSFEIHAARGDLETLKKLTRFTLESFYPAFVNGEKLDVVGFFAEVCRRTAVMVVEWMRVGFVHGVMNTDNMSILGLTIDYGPFGFLEPFDPGWTPNTTDAGGRRYRYGQQPRVAQWNLFKLANALVPVADDVEGLERALDAFATQVQVGQRAMMLGKLGLAPSASPTDDDALLVGLVELLTKTETDMTLFFRALADVPLEGTPEGPDALHAMLRDVYYAPEDAARDVLRETADFVAVYRARTREEAVTDDARKARMDAVNPLYIPRNYLLHETIERVAAGDHGALATMLDVYRRPYTVQEGREAFARKRPEWARHKPGCAMLSCSS